MVHVVTEQFYSCAMPVGVHVLPKLDLESRLGDALGTSKSTHCIPRLRQAAPVVLHVRTEAVGARARASISARPLHTVVCCSVLLLLLRCTSSWFTHTPRC